MIIHSNKQLEQYRKAAKISLDIMRAAADRIKPGVLPIDIEEYIWELMEKYKVKPAFFGVKQGRSPAFEYACNISVNDAALHGVPSFEQKLEIGDIVTLDLGIVYEGYYTDHCYTFVIKEFRNDEDKKLVNVTKLAVESSIKEARTGNYTGDLGYVMQNISELAGFNVLKGFVGHGIGKSLHEEIQIPAYGKRKTGDILQKGQVMCVEAQVVAGEDDVYIDSSDGWTVRTEDERNAAMFEYMVVVQDSKPIILTDNRDWPVLV